MNHEFYMSARTIIGCVFGVWLLGQILTRWAFHTPFTFMMQLIAVLIGLLLGVLVLLVDPQPK